MVQKGVKLVFSIRRRKMVAMIRSKTSDRVLKQENNPATSFLHKRTRIADRWRAGGPEKCKNPALFAENSCKNGAPLRTEDRPPQRAPVLTQEAHIPWADGMRRPPTPIKCNRNPFQKRTLWHSIPENQRRNVRLVEGGHNPLM